jgi:hypothetical protein
MNRRVVLGTLALLALVALGGCSTVLGPGSVNYDDLSKDADYRWETDADAYIEVRRSNYTAVYNVSAKTTGDNETIAVYDRDVLGTDTPLDLTALRFRYRNGTVLRFEGENVTATYPDGSTADVPDDRLTVSRTRRRTKVGVPTTDGQLGFTAPRNGKSLSTPTFVEGSYEVVLPERAAVGLPVLSSIRPGGYETRTDDTGRTHVRWEEVTASGVSVRYYLERDLLLFGGLLAAMLVVGLLGTVYYLLQIRETVRKREEVGLDVEVEDDDSEPPPGFR